MTSGFWERQQSEKDSSQVGDGLPRKMLFISNFCKKMWTNSTMNLFGVPRGFSVNSRSSFQWGRLSSAGPTTRSLPSPPKGKTSMISLFASRKKFRNKRREPRKLKHSCRHLLETERLTRKSRSRDGKNLERQMRIKGSKFSFWADFGQFNTNSLQILTESGNGDWY